MPKVNTIRLLPLLLWLAPLGISAQPEPLHSIAVFPMQDRGVMLRGPAVTGRPFTVAGPAGVLVGEQQGTLESWVLPIKLLSHLTLEAEVAGYPVPIDLNAAARAVEVRPDRTVITYSHIAVTVRQIMFAPDSMPPGTGAVVLFQVDSVRPVDLTLRFTGEMRPMWPKPGGGTPSAEWVAEGASGYYLLHTDFPELTGAVALPGAHPGIMAPYQERPQTHPLELKLHIDPADRGRLYPLLMAAGQTRETATGASLRKALAALNDQLPRVYAAHAARTSALLGSLTAIETPDGALNDALAWAEISIDQLRAREQVAGKPTGQTGLVAGYYESGDSARPGFGWFFGRDALYTLYALASDGDFALARQELSFLMTHQRADGKMMHEYSQTAGELDWALLPYEYAAADSTPLFLTAMLDYVRASGDLGFLRQHRDEVMRAWRFEQTHDADGDGIYDNAEGTGWVESWPSGMPRQEIYLALLDGQGSAAMGELARLLGDEATAAAATRRAATVRATIEREYLLPLLGRYGFSWDRGTLDASETVFPAVAWWNSGPGYTPGLAQPDESLRRWASPAFSTDWGARDLAESDPLYDPISYHQGSVWPLFTGWVSLAEYRGGHPLAGYASLMQNAGLTTAQDLGAVTELLSGAFFEPFGRSTSHQLWSSAMVVTPLLRGLFGLEPDALTHTLRVAPHLPAAWNDARVRRLHVGDSVIDLTLHREPGTMRVTLAPVSGPQVKLLGAQAGTTLSIPLPAVELGMEHALPEPGSRTAQPKVLAESTDTHTLRVEVTGIGGTVATFTVRRNLPGLHITAQGATLADDTLTVGFPTGPGYQTANVTLRW